MKSKSLSSERSLHSMERRPVDRFWERELSQLPTRGAIGIAKLLPRVKMEGSRVPAWIYLEGQQ